AEDGIRDFHVTGVQTCALPIFDAAEYKHVVLGLLFLKYISDSFDSHREKIKQQLEGEGHKGKQLERMLEDRDEYTADRVFWVPRSEERRVGNDATAREGPSAWT